MSAIVFPGKVALLHCCPGVMNPCAPSGPVAPVPTGTTSMVCAVDVAAFHCWPVGSAALPAPTLSGSNQVMVMLSVLEVPPSVKVMGRSTCGLAAPVGHTLACAL